MGEPTHACFLYLVDEHATVSQVIVSTYPNALTTSAERLLLLNVFLGLSSLRG